MGSLASTSLGPCRHGVAPFIGILTGAVIVLEVIVILQGIWGPGGGLSCLFPILPHSLMLYAALRKTHSVLAYLLFVAFIAHFGAVLFHTVSLRDRLFSRMAPYRVPAR
jgi:cytochrome b561